MSVEAVRDLLLLGRQYAAGEEIPEPEWAKVPERNRRAMASTRYVRDRVPEPLSTPALSKAPKRATR